MSPAVKSTARVKACSASPLRGGGRIGAGTGNQSSAHSVTFSPPWFWDGSHGLLAACSGQESGICPSCSAATCAPSVWLSNLRQTCGVIAAAAMMLELC